LGKFSAKAQITHGVTLCKFPLFFLFYFRESNVLPHSRPGTEAVPIKAEVTAGKRYIIFPQLTSQGLPHPA
jgi:hypothetical protein